MMHVKTFIHTIYTLVLEEVSYAHQGSIYLIENTVKNSKNILDSYSFQCHSRFFRNHAILVFKLNAI